MDDLEVKKKEAANVKACEILDTIEFKDADNEIEAIEQVATAVLSHEAQVEDLHKLNADCMKTLDEVNELRKKYEGHMELQKTQLERDKKEIEALRNAEKLQVQFIIDQKDELTKQERLLVEGFHALEIFGGAQFQMFIQPKERKQIQDFLTNLNKFQDEKKEKNKAVGNGGGSQG